jgi:two-component system, OmpR family, KDP operon response regulator KdpE
MSEQTSILIIEDEVEIRKFLRAALSAQGLNPIEAATAHEGMQKLTLTRPDLVLLDLGLPDQDGQAFIKSVREWSDVPIIVVSARDQETQKIEALENGADDYLTKPFAAGELLARIKVALRHSRRVHSDGSAQYEFGDLKVNLQARHVTLKSEDVHLTPIEYKLLSVLAKHAGKVITHAQLLKEVWGRHSVENNNNLRIHMQHLREKLKDDALNPVFIMTEPGIGYRLRL